MNLGKIPTKTARLDPDREALIDIPNKRRITYGELEQRVKRLANGLIDQFNVVKGDRVAVLSKNSIEYMEVYFACARIGLIIQPLNWRLGVPELSRILNDGEPNVLVHADEYSDTVEQLEFKKGGVNKLSYGPESDGSYERILTNS